MLRAFPCPPFPAKANFVFTTFTSYSPTHPFDDNPFPPVSSSRRLTSSVLEVNSRIVIHYKI